MLWRQVCLIFYLIHLVPAPTYIRACYFLLSCHFTDAFQMVFKLTLPSVFSHFKWESQPEYQTSPIPGIPVARPSRVLLIARVKSPRAPGWYLVQASRTSDLHDSALSPFTLLSSSLSSAQHYGGSSDSAPSAKHCLPWLQGKFQTPEPDSSGAGKMGSPGTFLPCALLDYIITFQFHGLMLITHTFSLPGM